MFAILVSSIVALGFGLAAAYMPAPVEKATKPEPTGLHVSAGLDVNENPKPNVLDDPKPREKEAPVYALKEGELLKLIPPNAESRGDVFQKLMPGSNIPPHRMLMVIDVHANELKLKTVYIS